MNYGSSLDAHPWLQELVAERLSGPVDLTSIPDLTVTEVQDALALALLSKQSFYRDLTSRELAVLTTSFADPGLIMSEIVFA